MQSNAPTTRRAECLSTERGSFLLELLLAFGILSITTTLVIGTYVASQRSYRAAIAEADVVRALTFYIEDMTREARLSNAFGCAINSDAVVADAQECTEGGSFSMSRVASINNQGEARITYTDTTKTVDGETRTMVPPTVEVTDFEVQVIGDGLGDPQRAIITLTAHPRDGTGFTSGVTVSMHTSFTERAH